jgi:hypothetical protein
MKLKVGDTLGVVTPWHPSIHIGDLVTVFLVKPGVFYIDHWSVGPVPFMEYEFDKFFTRYEVPKVSGLNWEAYVVTYSAPRKCTCGSDAVKHPGHSSWCDKFDA